MTRFMLLYRAPASAREQMANSTAEQKQAGMEAWMAWAGKAGDALVEFGMPLQPATVVGAEGDSDALPIGGYSIMEAGSIDALTELVEAHPHLHMDGAAIEILELLPAPGM